MAQQSETPGLPNLSRGDDLPVGVNLAWRLQVLIQTGRLPALERLPGVRELAAGAAVNVNTARSVYRRLEDSGLAVSRQGLGTFVAPYVTVAPTLEQFAAEVASEAIAQGIDPRELARALYSGSPSTDPFTESLEEAGELSPEEARRARESLRGQIARLEASLAAYPEGADPYEAGRGGGPFPGMTSLSDLERIRDDLVGRLKRARSEAEAKAEEQDLARARLERAATDPSAHKWEAGAVEGLGEPGCGRWQVSPAWGPVGALMNWWRVKISSGCP
jgi:DNA-binding transcriptional regulator YhcF (GntR family)